MQKIYGLTLPPMGYQILWLPWGGASEAPPSEIKEGVIFDQMLLYSICYLVFLGVTCNKSARNLKIWARFQDFKILWNGKCLLFPQFHYLFQGVGVSLMLVQGMSGVYSIVITSWMFVYFRDSFITIHQPYKWSRCEKDVPAFENLRHCHLQNANHNWSLEQVNHFKPKILTK